RVPVAALLQADVVVRADPGEEGDLLAAQARDAAVALAGHPRGGGLHLCSADAQAPAQGAGICGGWHASRLNTAAAGRVALALLVLTGPGPSPADDAQWQCAARRRRAPADPRTIHVTAFPDPVRPPLHR